MVIGITGKARTGKDSIGYYLQEKYSFNKMSLADPIKKVVKDVFVLSDFETYDEVQREKKLEKWPEWSARELFQLVGTDCFREKIYNLIWVKSLWLRIQDTDPNADYVITDIRFPDEAEYFRNMCPSFVLLSVSRPNCTGKVGIIGHATEKYDLRGDYHINNDGTKEELYSAVDNFVQKLTTDSLRDVLCHK